MQDLKNWKRSRLQKLFDWVLRLGKKDKLVRRLK